MSRVGVGVAVGLVLVLGALVVDLSRHGDRLAGSNSRVEVSRFALPVAPRTQLCAAHQSVPSGASSARVYAGTYGRRGGPFAISITAGGRVVAAGRAAGGYADNATPRVPITPVRHNLYDATVCLRNVGTTALKFAGNLTPIAGFIPGGQEVIRYDWLLPGRPTWLDVGPRVAARFAVVKPGFVGAWTFWALFVVVGALWAAAIVLLLRGRAE